MLETRPFLIQKKSNAKRLCGPRSRSNYGEGREDAARVA